MNESRDIWGLIDQFANDLGLVFLFVLSVIGVVALTIWIWQ